MCQRWLGGRGANDVIGPACKRGFAGRVAQIQHRPPVSRNTTAWNASTCLFRITKRRDAREPHMLRRPACQARLRAARNYSRSHNTGRPVIAEPRSEAEFVSLAATLHKGAHLSRARCMFVASPQIGSRRHNRGRLSFVHPLDRPPLDRADLHGLVRHLLPGAHRQHPFSPQTRPGS